jgi:hypothetical protein
MMPIRVALALALLLFTLHLPACDRAQAEEVRDAYDQINAAFDANDGKTVVALLNQKSIDQYDRYTELARTGTRDQIKALPAAERSEIVMIRHRLTRSELQGLDGRGWLVLATSRGWYASVSGEEPLRLGRIRFQGSSATAEILIDHRLSGYYYDFDLIDGVWKLDWVRVDELTNRRIAAEAELSHTSEDNVILRWESDASGEKVPLSIWDPR